MFLFVFVVVVQDDGVDVDGLEEVHVPSSSFSLAEFEQTPSSSASSIGGSGKGPTGGEDGVDVVEVVVVTGDVAGVVPNINCQRDAKIPCCTSSSLCALLFVDGVGTEVSSAAATNKNVTGNN